MKDSRNVIEITKELIEEVMGIHSDPESPDYNQCDEVDGECFWCEQAKGSVKWLNNLQGKLSVEALEEIMKEWIAGTPCNTLKSELFTLSWGDLLYLAKAIRKHILEGE